MLKYRLNIYGKDEIMKIELHVHSTGFSYCGKLSIEELIPLYSAKKYDAVVLTNHFNSFSAKYYAENGGKNYHRDYHDMIRRAKEIGKKYDLLVLGGYELRFDENANDYLVYGMTEEFTRDYSSIFTNGVTAFSEAARKNGFLLYQAHPFRNGMTVTKPEILFGIEVQNTHPRHDSRNDIAMAWAEKYGLHKIAGSDCHQIQDVGTSAIITDETVRNEEDLVDILKNDRFTIIREPQKGL